jgi:hypothetical protein
MKRLLELAERNDEALIADYEYQKLLYPDDVPLIEEFIRAIQLKGEVTVNCSLQSMGKILDSGEYKNIFQLNVEEKEIGARYNRYGNFHSRLVKFVNDFDPNRQIKYGALNLGTIGIPFNGFGGGTCCFSLKSEFIQKADREGLIACLAKYSLYYYQIETLELHTNFKDEISTYHGLPFLALKKHYQKGLTKARDSWKSLILNEKELLEVLIGAPIQTTDINGIKIDKELFDKLIRLNSDKVESHDVRDLQFLRTFLHIKTHCKEANIQIESI